MILALDSSAIVTIVLSGFGVTGIVGAIAAMYKLRPEVDSSVVIQAKGTVDMMHILLDEQRTELARKDGENVALRKVIAERDDTIRVLRRQLFQQIDDGSF